MLPSAPPCVCCAHWTFADASGWGVRVESGLTLTVYVEGTRRSHACGLRKDRSWVRGLLTQCSSHCGSFLTSYNNGFALELRELYSFPGALKQCSISLVLSNSLLFPRS